MTPLELTKELANIVRAGIMDPVMIVGGPGIGKSSIVQQAGAQFDLPIYDLRWSQMLLSDTRFPVPDHDNKCARFYMSNLFPRTGPGILFLDEYNLASPAMMQIGQQLFLDRCYGDYKVPDDVFIWTAGNLKIHGAAVNEIPTPVNNRCAHYDVVADLWSWKVWAYPNGIDPRIIGFLDWKSELLYNVSKTSRAWPSPRSWVMADRRLKNDMDIGPAVGDAVEAEFDSYIELIQVLPDIKAIAAGRGANVKFPEEPSQCFSLIAELTARGMSDFQTFRNCFEWAARHVDNAEWTTLLAQGTMNLLRVSNDKKKHAEYVKGLATLPALRAMIEATTRAN